MRVEGPVSIDRALNIVNPANAHESHTVQERAAINRSGYLKELPKNFKTMDPKRYEPVTIGELELIEAIERANKSLTGVNTNFKFSIHEDTKAIMVKVINSETQEVIREIPPEKILDMVAKMWEIAGIFVDRHI